MGWPRRLIVVRHALSEGNVLSKEDRSTATTPNHAFDLAPQGRLQAQEARDRVLKYGPFDAHYCSTFKRTAETHRILFPDITPVPDPRLNEWWSGIWHTMSAERRDALYPDEAAIKDREGLYHYRAPGGENGPDVELRIHSFLASLRADHAGQDVLLLGHGHWMLFLWRVLLGRSVAEFEERHRYRKYPNIGIAVYQWDARGRLSYQEPTV